MSITHLIYLELTKTNLKWLYYLSLIDKVKSFNYIQYNWLFEYFKNIKENLNYQSNN